MLDSCLEISCDFCYLVSCNVARAVVYRTSTLAVEIPTHKGGLTRDVLVKLRVCRYLSKPERTSTFKLISRSIVSNESLVERPQ